jgi:hypothetical protein
MLYAFQLDSVRPDEIPFQNCFSVGTIRIMTITKMKSKWATLLCAVIGSGCSQGYVVRDESVYFHGWNEGHGRFEHEVSGADIGSFQTLDDFFAKDNHRAYAYGWEIQGADPTSFKVLRRETAADKNSCYRGTPSQIPESRLKPFHFAEGYVIGSGNVSWHFWRGDGSPYEYVIKGADVATFNSLEFGFAVDKDRAYWRGQPIVGVDVATLTVMNACDLKDKNGLADWRWQSLAVVPRMPRSRE